MISEKSTSEASMESRVIPPKNLYGEIRKLSNHPPLPTPFELGALLELDHVAAAIWEQLDAEEELWSLRAPPVPVMGKIINELAICKVDVAYDIHSSIEAVVGEMDTHVFVELDVISRLWHTVYNEAVIASLTPRREV